MYEGLVSRLQQLARRAGMRDVPASALISACVLAAVIVGWALWHWWPQPSAEALAFDTGGAVSVEASSVVAPVEATSQPAEQASRLMVHVVGSVRHPGVYELDPGSRVIDAVDAAGGTLPDAILSAVNMARPVGDGEQILVPDEDDPAAVAAAAGGGGTGGGAGAAALAAGGAGGQQAVDINSADAAALETLPGVGPSTAAKIIADRESNGPFASVDDLTRVSGIGPKKLEQIKPMACVR
jgi:competence protein ComEA